MVVGKRRILLLIYYCVYIFALLINEAECQRRRNKAAKDAACCEVIKVSSAGFAAQFHPQLLGSYRLVKDSIYRHLTNPASFIFPINLKHGPTWVIGEDYTKTTFKVSWPRKVVKERNDQPRTITASFFSRPIVFYPPPAKEHQSKCPLEVGVDRRNYGPHRSPFKVWDGKRFLDDDTFEIACSVDRLEEIIDGCCEMVRVASANVNSLSMQHQKHRMGYYKAVGRMNGQLVYEQINSNGPGSNLYAWRNEVGVDKWFIGTNYTQESHAIESEKISGHRTCVTDMAQFTVYTKFPHHVMDEARGWKEDNSLRIECFDAAKSQQCCPTIEVTSNSIAAQYYPHLMGSYQLDSQYQVSGRRVYRQNRGKYLIYLHDWGPNSGMEWRISGQLGDPSYKAIISGSVEKAFPLNMCLTDANTLGGFRVWDGQKWAIDTTLSISCTFYY